jgi:hypothetical protein
MVSVAVQLEAEQIALFKTLWGVLKAEEKTLEDEFNIARNLACSEWTVIGHDPFGVRQPTKMLPDTMELLRINHAASLEELSRRKYFLLKAFLPTLKAADLFGIYDHGCYEYWEKELKKKKPELLDRFRDLNTDC